MAKDRFITLDAARAGSLTGLANDVQVLDGAVVIDREVHTTNLRELVVCATHKVPLEAGVGGRAYHYSCKEKGCKTTMVFPASVANRGDF